MASRRDGLVGKILQEVEVRTGSALVPTDRLNILEAAMGDVRAMQRELDMLGYTALDYANQNTKELAPENRKTLAQKALVMWIYDPLYGRAVSMLNDFTFGRGVPQPRAKDKKVQEILDTFWNDRDNKIVLTTAEAQRALGVDLSNQCNLFILFFDQGKDGKIKIGLLNHDSVDDVVEDEENRLRVLYYIARERKRRWDYKQEKYVPVTGDGGIAAKPKITYYEHYANVKSLEADSETVEKPSEDQIGDGLVYHIALNRTAEMHFGVPEAVRVMRWATAYNEFMNARVDMMKAAAAFVMKRKAQATPNQLAKLATRAISRQSPLAGVVDPFYPTAGRAGSIINENQAVQHEPIKLDSGSSNAVQDGGMLHAQIAVGTGFPTHYLGNNDSNLATATALELTVLKLVEGRQEVFEALFRTVFDMVIQKAIDDGKLEENADPSDDNPGELPQQIVDPYSQIATEALIEAGMVSPENRVAAVAHVRERLGLAAKEIMEGIEDEAEQERETKRDLSYEFSMPSPLRRMMTDLVTAIQGIAQTFDPNNTNTELSRALLAIALGEGLEVDDPASLVEKIFPPGYVDPLIAAAQQAQQAPQPGEGGNVFGPGAKGPVPAPGQGGDESAGGGGQGYGAPMKATAPEDVYGAQEARFVATRGRMGQIVFVPLQLRESAGLRRQRADEDEAVATAVRGGSVALDQLFDSEVGRVATEELAALTTGAATNSNHEGGTDDGASGSS